MNYNDLVEWKTNTSQLTRDIDRLINPYNGILDTYAAARDAAINDEEKENIDTVFRELTDSKNRLCALMGGRRRSSRRRSKIPKRSRKHRR
jgi:hypothetical protein